MKEFIFRKRKYAMGAQDLEDSYTQSVALPSAIPTEAHPSIGREPTAIIRIGCRLPIRVLIASHHNLVREGLRLSLAQQEGMQIIGTAADGPQILHMVETLQPDILLLYVQKPNACELVLLSNIRVRSPRTHVLILSDVLEDVFIAEALQQGAIGYLLKTASQRDLVKAIYTTYAEELRAQRKVLTEMLDRMCQKMRELHGLSLKVQETLTDREREITTWVMRGMTNKEIATQLNISEKTVKAHLRSIFQKLEISRRAQLFYALGLK
jgi:DNA-binding NarL/FixJ family response regulator